MPTQLQKGHTYNPGDIVDAADLNAIVDNGTVVKGAITEATTAAPTTPASDWVLYYNNAVGDLRKCHISQLPPGVTSIGMTVAPTTVFSPPGGPFTTTGTFTVGLKNQTPNKVLVGPASGAANTPSFRELVPADITQDTVLIADTDIDWTLGSVFGKTLIAGVGPIGLHHINMKNGQTIKVRIKQNAAGTNKVNWFSDSPITWAEGSEPEMPFVADAFGVYVFTAISETGPIRIHGFLEGAGTAVGTVSHVSATATPTGIFDIAVTNASTMPGIALSLDVQSANKVLAGPASGADAVPAFRALTPADIVGLTGFVALGAGFNIDLTLGNAFWKVFSTTTPTLTFVTGTGTPGQVFKVWVKQTAGTATTLSWVAGGGTIRWPGGVAPVFTPTPLAIDVFEFFCTAANTFEGIRWGANFS